MKIKSLDYWQMSEDLCIYRYLIVNTQSTKKEFHPYKKGLNNKAGWDRQESNNKCVFLTYAIQFRSVQGGTQALGGRGAGGGVGAYHWFIMPAFQPVPEEKVQNKSGTGCRRINTHLEVEMKRAQFYLDYDSSPIAKSILSASLWHFSNKLIHADNSVGEASVQTPWTVLQQVSEQGTKLCIPTVPPWAQQHSMTALCTGLAADCKVLTEESESLLRLMGWGRGFIGATCLHHKGAADWFS